MANFKCGHPIPAGKLWDGIVPYRPGVRGYEFMEECWATEDCRDCYNAKPWPSFRGKFPCPKCGSTETGSHEWATSGRWIKFKCDSCRHEYRKSAATISPMSKHLRRAMG